MGGYGSGRRYSSKSTTADLRKLDIRWLVRQDLLRPSQSSTLTWSRRGVPDGSISLRYSMRGITLDYRHKAPGRDWHEVSYAIELAYTPCHLGGERVWFVCPAQGCGRRVAILYGGKIYACRQCHNLGYESQVELRHYRGLSRAQGIRMRLGGSGSMADPFPAKPKGMHWKTYDALHLKSALDAGASNRHIAKSLGISLEDLD